ncbi:MAG: STAS domain-containing protein [Bryobacteraceae bacterium]|jgi:anti-anti-sigma regulatory factor
MTTNEIVQEALGKLDGGRGEVILDFSSVSRIDSSDLRALDSLAQTAQAKSVKLALYGVSVPIHKVLKLAKPGGTGFSLCG